MSVETITRSDSSILTQIARPRRRVVQHLYWRKDLDLADAYGIEIKTLCGLWRKQDDEATHTDVPIVGGLVPLTEPSDCQRCAKVYAKRCRDNWTRWQKANR